MKYNFHPAALTEYSEAVQFYCDRSNFSALDKYTKILLLFPEPLRATHTFIQQRQKINYPVL